MRGLAIVLVLLAAGGGRRRTGDARPMIGDTAQQTRSVNPRHLHALQLLDHRTPGVPPRIRFEWDPVPGARRYVLTGRWTSPPSWAIQSEQERVSPKNAIAWDTHRVAFELSLPEGMHSWSVVALFGADEHGDFTHPATVMFDVR
jgi:hypothetical protein